MKLLTEDATLTCAHMGVVKVGVRQSWVTVEGKRVLINDDPESRDIDRCPNRGPTIKKCGKTLRVKSGYSAFVRIDARPVCLDSLHGLTDGTPPGMVRYLVRDPAQTLVEASA